MPTSLIRWLSQGYKVASEYRWLLGLIAAMLTFGSTVGIGLIRVVIREEMAGPVDMISWDFERRGIWKDYLDHKAKVTSEKKAFRPEPSASAGYPIFHFGEP